MQGLQGAQPLGKENQVSVRWQILLLETRLFLAAVLGLASEPLKAHCGEIHKVCGMVDLWLCLQNCKTAM